MHSGDDQDKPHDLYEEVERRALFDLPDDEADDQVDLIQSLTGPAAETAAQAPGDLSLGGYIELHNRPPAFEGSDQQPYTVAVEVEENRVGSGYTAFLVFIRWAATGAGIVEHLDSDDVAQADTRDAAYQRALDLTLYEVKTALDSVIERRLKDLEV